VDPLTEPLFSHPQTTRTRSAPGTERVAPGSLHLGRYREQCPGHRAQGPPLRDAGGLGSPGAPRRDTARLPQVRSGLARTTRGRGRATRLGRDVAGTCLRMAGVACRDPLRMVGVAIVLTLRMMGVAGFGTGPGNRRGLGHGQSRSPDGSALHRPPAAIAARASASRHAWWSPAMCQTASVISPAGRGSITPIATRRIAALSMDEGMWRAKGAPAT
jgi:hypothetical protein